MFSHAGRFLLGLALLAVLCDPARAAEIPVDGQVLGVDGTRLPGVRVELRPALLRYEAGVLELAVGDEPAPVAQDVTGSLGRFQVSVPRAGLWRMVARADGYVPMEIPVFPVLEERSLPAIRLRPDRGLRVRVVGPDGKPIPGVRVLGQTEKAVLWGALWQPSGRLAVSDPDGGLRLSRAAGEPLRLWAAGPGFPAQGGILADKGDAVLPLQKGERRLDGKLPLALTAPATGHWTGRIVDASSRHPVAGALVWASDDPSSATWTDAAGTYRLSGRVPGSHGRLQAAAVEYASNSLSVDLPLGSSASFQKVADLPLVPAPVPAISGVVVDEAAKPVAGAEILLVDPEAGGAPPQLRRARTSPAGSFRIARLQAGGSYALTASRPGFAPATLQVTVPLPTQSQAAIRLILRRGRTASGLVVDPHRRPISGAAVRLTPAPATRGHFSHLSEPQPELRPSHAATGPDGRFRIPDLPEGFFELRIEGPELAPLPNKEIWVPGGGGSVDLGTFTLESRARVAGWIVDPGGQPLEGVEIWVVPEDHPEIPQASPATVTGPDGRYELLDRAVGNGEVLRACRKGFVRKEFPAKVPEAPRIVLAPTVHLAGRVMGADGEPLPGARISATPAGQVRYPGLSDPPCGFSFAPSALTGPEGAFTLELAEAGWYDMAAAGAGHLDTRLDRLHVPPEGLDGLEIRMDGGTTVSGHVADPEGHPVVGVKISLQGPRSFVEASSDDGGNFLLEGVETGEGNINVSHAQFTSEARNVQIRPQGTRIDLALHPIPLFEVRGRVIGPDGAPIMGAIITDGVFFLTSTLADGSFLLQEVKGVHRLLAETDGLAPTETDITLEDRSIDGVEIRLSYGLTLTGRVLGIDPAAVGKISVFGTWRAREAPIDSEGRFRVPHLPQGEWSLYAQVGDRIAEDKLTPPAGLTEVVHDLQFPPVSKIRGRVTGPGGEPIEGASLSFPNAKNIFTGFQTYTLADGSFAVGVTDGTYNLDVSAEGYSSQSAERQIVVAGAPVEDVEIQLAPNIVLSGRLLGLEPGETLQEFQVKGPPSCRPGIWNADHEGHYSQEGLSPGDWTITARFWSDFRSWPRQALGRIHIPPGATEATLDLDFHVGDLTLTVRSAHPGESLRATLLDADGSALISDLPYGENEVFRFQRLQAGTYRLRIDDQQGKKLQEQPIALKADREVVVDLPPANLDENPPR